MGIEIEDEEKIRDFGTSGIMNVNEPTEIGDALTHLNDDRRDPEHKMSKIDMNTRLHPIEISALLAIDFLVASKFLPARTLNLTLQKKRLNISLAGKGRQEIVDIVAGKRERDIKRGMGIGDRFNAFMGKN